MFIPCKSLRIPRATLNCRKESFLAFISFLLYPFQECPIFPNEIFQIGLKYKIAQLIKFNVR